VDIKKLGRIGCVGHRITGNRRQNSRGIGWEFVHVAIDDASRLSYAEGATMVQMIIDKYGRKAIADIAAAYRAGAGDAEALKAGTGISAEQLYANYFASFGADAPSAVKPAAIPPSNVKKPPQPAAASGEELPSQSPAPVEQPTQSTADLRWVVLIVVAGLAVGAIGAVLVRRRRPPIGLQ